MFGEKFSQPQSTFAMRKPNNKGLIDMCNRRSRNDFIEPFLQIYFSTLYLILLFSSIIQYSCHRSLVAWEGRDELKALQLLIKMCEDK